MTQTQILTTSVSEVFPADLSLDTLEVSIFDLG